MNRGSAIFASREMYGHFVLRTVTRQGRPAACCNCGWNQVYLTTAQAGGGMAGHHGGVKRQLTYTLEG